jgi:hypothetical protein
MIITSYATERYWAAARRLEQSLKRFDMKCHIEYMQDFSNVKGHKIYKPFFLEQMMNNYQDEEIILVDADSVFLKRLPELDIKSDMGLVLGKQNERHQYWFSDAFHIHRPTPGTRDFIRIWKRLCEDRDWIIGNNHPRILATFYLTRHMTTWEFIDLKGSFARNFGKRQQMNY